MVVIPPGQSACTWAPRIGATYRRAVVCYDGCRVAVCTQLLRRMYQGFLHEGSG